MEYTQEMKESLKSSKDFLKGVSDDELIELAEEFIDCEIETCGLIQENWLSSFGDFHSYIYQKYNNKPDTFSSLHELNVKLIKVNKKINQKNSKRVLFLFTTKTK
ncbi:protein of unknown function [Tenacibaculum sp. 190524A02b]|uniref:hypothetical protein n=1 Tax=Tenacibaculum vairaonense TaxID=3137860 RepID=UPI0032B1C6B4